MDDFHDTVRTGAREVAERSRPASAAAVRARGERLRHGRAVGAIALAAVGVIAVGGTAVAVFRSGDGGHHETVTPGPTGTPVNRPSQPSPSMTSSTTTSPATPPSTSPTEVPSPSTDQASKQSTPTSAAKPPQSTPAACTPADLAITSSPWTGRTGHTIGIFLFHNTGSAACRISGHPRVSGLNAQGVTTTVATDTLTGWAGNLSSVPTVDIPPGGYASAGVEWRNGTDGRTSCALVATFEVALPSGGPPTKIPAGTPSLTDGPACAGFEIHPIRAGFDSDYFYAPFTPPATSGG